MAAGCCSFSCSIWSCNECIVKQHKVCLLLGKNSGRLLELVLEILNNSQTIENNAL
jgi:hypothetical protein